MKDGDSAGEPAEVSRRELYGDYVNFYLRPGAEVRPCRDPSLLERSARYLRRDPEPAEAFTVFPFHRAVSRERASRGRANGRKHLTDLMKATELLETICVNLFLQPWKKEIKTLKTFTGPFIYGLLPVLSSSTIQFVLGSIGYLPHTDTAQSEYRLCEDVNTDRAMLLGFELLLARVKCDHLLEVLEKDPLEPQEFLDVLQGKKEPAAPDEPPEKTTTVRQKEEENKTMEEAHGEEVPLVLDPALAVKPQPKPRRLRLTGVDQSIMEMQMSYPDLAFRGRPLLPDKPQRANGGGKDGHAPSTGGDGKAAEVPKGDGGGVGVGRDGTGGGPAAGDADSGHIGASDGSTADGELGGPRALSLHITLRAATTAEPGLKPGEAPSTAEPHARTRQQTGAALQSNRAAMPESLSLSLTTDESQELRELAESMSQLHVGDATEEGKSGKEGHRREEGNGNKRRSQTESEAEGEEDGLGGPAAKGPAPGRSSRSSRSGPAATATTEEQKQRRAPRREAEDAASFVMVEHHNR